MTLISISYLGGKCFLVVTFESLEPLGAAYQRKWKDAGKGRDWQKQGEGGGGGGIEKADCEKLNKQENRVKDTT